MSIYEIDFSGKGLVKIDAKRWNDLEPGRVLYFHGYSNDSYVIIKRNISDYDGRALYDTINLRTFQKRKQDTTGLKHISEKKDNRIAVYVTDDIMDAEGIMDAIDGNKKAEVQVELEKMEANRKYENDKARLLKMFDYLEVIPEGSYKHRVIGAKNIRKELKKRFGKKYKFSVRGSSFSMGDSIDIEYPEDLPEEGQEWIRKLCDKYQKGSFDGMIDLYEYSPSVFNDLFGGAKYVMSQRAY
jgi:hypothetical protein